MKVFQIKSKPHDNERLSQFLTEKFICIGWPGIGDLSQADKDEIRKRMANEFKVTGHQLGNWLGQVNCFVNTMKKGNIILLTENEWAHIGILGEYVYLNKYDNDQDGMCHRRNVEWINTVKISDLSTTIQKFLSNRNAVSKYPEPYEVSDLQKHIKNKVTKDISNTTAFNSTKIDELVEEAIKVIEEELKSIDPDRRLKAASILLCHKGNII